MDADSLFKAPDIGGTGGGLLDERQYTDEEFLESIRDVVGDILKKRFPAEPQKQRIKKTRSGLNFACPFCGDSAISATRKRGHIIMDGKFRGNYKCFNCGQFMSVFNFMRRFERELDLGQVDYLAKNTSDEYRTYGGAGSARGFSDSSYFKVDEIREYAVSKARLCQCGLSPVHPDDRAGQYLRSRFQGDYDNYLYDDNGKWLAILNRIDDDAVIGFQVRDMTGRRKTKYLSMTLSKIHKQLLADGVEVPAWIDNISTTFNLFRIDMTKPVIVTEGPFDANLLPNAIALSGANKNSGGLPMRLYYMFDDDPTGRKLAVGMLDRGEKVFLWSKFRRDYGIPDRPKWDVNDVVKYFAENRMSIKPQWLSYFSDDALDTIDI